MKHVIIVISLLLPFILQAQWNEAKPIRANTVDIYGADKKPLAKMAIINGLKRNLLLKSLRQERDSSGGFITQFVFCTMKHLPSTDVRLVLQFDKAIDSIEYEVDENTLNPRSTSKVKTGSSFQADVLMADATITATIKSRYVILTTIVGIAGQIRD